MRVLGCRILLGSSGCEFFIAAWVLCIYSRIELLGGRSRGVDRGRLGSVGDLLSERGRVFGVQGGEDLREEGEEVAILLLTPCIVEQDLDHRFGVDRFVGLGLLGNAVDKRDHLGAVQRDVVDHGQREPETSEKLVVVLDCLVDALACTRRVASILVGEAGVDESGADSRLVVSVSIHDLCASFALWL